MIAQVIVDVTNSQVDKIFDYEIKDMDIKIGQRVFVPFGNRIIQGFVIGLCETSNVEPLKLKQIIDVVDDFSCITEEMIMLMHYMIKKYHLKLMMLIRY